MPSGGRLAGVAAGRPSKEIAADLGIGERTIESHLRRMFDRYGVLNRIELIGLAGRNGWTWRSGRRARFAARSRRGRYQRNWLRTAITPSRSSRYMSATRAIASTTAAAFMSRVGSLSR